MPELKTAPLGHVPIPYNWSYADAAARTGATGFIAADVGKFARQLDDNSIWMLIATAPTWVRVSNSSEPTGTPFEMVVACSDEDTVIAAGTAKVTFRMPRAVTLTAVRAHLKTAAASGTFTVDINEGGTTILSTKITIDATEKTSVTAVTPPVISDSALADDAEITVDVDDDADGAATGLKIVLIGTRA